MKIEFQADPNARQIRLCIIARERSPQVEEIIRRLQAEDSIVGYNDRGAVQIGFQLGGHHSTIPEGGRGFSERACAGRDRRAKICYNGL